MAMKKLSPPKSQMRLLSGDCKLQWRALERKVTEHPFNHAVELVFPGHAQLPPSLTSSSSSSLPHYYTSCLPPSHVIQPEVIQRYLKDGSLVALSLDRHIDSDNVVAVLPSGKLLLSVDKDTYEQLGLQGRPSRFMKPNRFVVEIDTTATHFRPGKPNYDRVKWSLDNTFSKEETFAISWYPKVMSDDQQFLGDFKAQRHKCSTDKELLHNFPLPVLSGDHPHGGIENDAMVSCPAVELQTWLGAIACGVDMPTGQSDDYVSTFGAPEPYSICQYGTRTRWTGMVSSQWICSLLENIRQHLATTSPSPWATVNVWGFEDSPVSWRDSEHGWYLSGDNHYTIVLFSTGQYWCMSVLGTHDIA